MPDVTSIVFVVDDDVSVRESLELLIKNAGWQPETFASAQDFLSRPRADRSLLPGARCDAAGTQRPRAAAAARRPDRHADHLHHRLRRRAHDACRAMKAGAVEFLTKPFKDDVLLNAIRGAIERSRAALRLDSEMRALRDCYASLTPREREVMALVVSGLLNKQVGGELGISEITVKAHRGQVMRKMKADSLPDLVTMAARLGLRPAPKH